MLLIIGLDGATLRLLDPWMDQGRLPALRALRDAGSHGPLRSTLPPVTAPAWASFVTGKTPAGHGVYDFLDGASPDLDRPRLVNGDDVRGETLWDVLSRAGRRVGVLNVPLTFPPRPLRGFLVSGLLTPGDAPQTYPPDLLAPYAPAAGPYRLTPGRLYVPGQEDLFAAALREMTASQIEYAARLAIDRCPDVLMVHFLASDIAQHKLWHLVDPAHPWHDPGKAALHGHLLRDLFVQLDTGIARLREAYPAEHVVVLSDHGFGPQHGIVNLNLALAEAGLLAWRPGRGRALRRIASGRHWTAALGHRLLGPGPLVGYKDVDWGRTRAFALGHLGQIAINLRGRQPRGVVSPSDYEQVCAAVESALKELRDPKTGRLIDAEVWRASAGEPPAVGPDLHVALDGYRLVAHPLCLNDGGLVARPRWLDSGSHRRDGVLFAAGPALRQGAIDGARLIDLAPTILHLLDVPVPDDMEGRVLADNFRADGPAARPEAFQPPQARLVRPMAASDEARLHRRLKDLGYLGP